MRIGRAKRSVWLAQRMFFGICRPSIRPSTSSCASAASVAVSASTTAQAKPSRSSRPSASRPWRRANPVAACVQPSAFCATASGGPRCSTRSAAWRPGTSRASTAIRRGETCASTDVAASRRSSSRRATSRGRVGVGDPACGGRQLLAAELDQEIRHAGLQRLHVRGGDGAGQVPDARDVADPLGDRDRAARVEQVEGVRALQHLVVGRQRQAPRHAAPAHSRSWSSKWREQHVDVGRLEVVRRQLALVRRYTSPYVTPGAHAGRRRSPRPAGTSRAARAP